MSLLLRKLNAYPEWESKAKIDDVAKYIKDGEMPTYVKTKLQQQRYTDKYGSGTFVVKKVGNKQRLFYNPSPCIRCKAIDFFDSVVRIDCRL